MALRCTQDGWLNGEVSDDGPGIPEQHRRYLTEASKERFAALGLFC